MSEFGSALTVTKLRDGSACEVEDNGRMALVSRLVDGERVWGQVFSGGPDEHAALVRRVVADMEAAPERYTRRDLWDAQGRAVK